MIRRPYIPGRKDSSSKDVNSQLLLSPRSLSPSCFPFFFFSPSFRRSLLLYILLLHSSSSYTCQSSVLILKCTSYRLLFLALCELLWLSSHCPRVTSTSMGSGCQLWVFNAEVIASPGVAFLPCSYGWPIGLGISFGILKGLPRTTWRFPLL